MANDRPFTELENALLGLTPVPVRDPRRAARTRSEFLIEAGRLKAVSPGRLVRLNQRMSALFGLRLRRTFTLLAVLLAVLAAAGTASAAGAALPGERLYPVKLFVEDLRLALAIAPQRKLELHLSFAGERIWELGRLQAEGRGGGEAAHARFAFHARAAAQLLAGLAERKDYGERLEELMRAYRLLESETPAERPAPATPPILPADYLTPVFDPTTAARATQTEQTGLGATATPEPPAGSLTPGTGAPSQTAEAEEHDDEEDPDDDMPEEDETEEEKEDD